MWEVLLWHALLLTLFTYKTVLQLLKHPLHAVVPTSPDLQVDGQRLLPAHDHLTAVHQLDGVVVVALAAAAAVTEAPAVTEVSRVCYQLDISDPARWNCCSGPGSSSTYSSSSNSLSRWTC
jgi:hypothetical protein